MSSSTATARSAVDRRIIRLAVPAFGTLAAEPLYRLVDTAIVGRLGTDELGGVAIGVAVLSLVIGGSNFLAYGTTERVARRLGAGDRAAAGDVGIQALWLAAVVGALAVPALVLGARPAALLLGAEGEVLDLAVTYLRISAVGVPLVLLGLASQGVQRGASDYRTPLWILVAANLVNVLIEPVLVFGADLGVAGAAWSTVIAQSGAGIALLLSVRRHLTEAVVRRPSWPLMAPLVTAGRHLLLRVGSMLAVFTGATAVAARVDAPTLAAHQIALSMFLFLALSLDALAVPAQTLVAEELGREGGEQDGRGGGTRHGREGGTRHGDRAEAGAALVSRRVVVLSLVVGTALAIVLALASPLFAGLFTDDPAVRERATAALRLLAATMLPGAVAFAYDGVLIGAGDYRFLGRAAVAYLAAVIPIAALVLAVPSLGIAGIWTGLLSWMALRAVVNHVRAGTVLDASFDA